MDPLTVRRGDSTPSDQASGGRLRTLQTIGIFCGLTAGAWLGAAEAPTKLVTIGISPVVVSLAMVVGVFVASDHNYIHHGSVGQVVSALAAILLWPLILLFHVNLHIH